MPLKDYQAKIIEEAFVRLVDGQCPEGCDDSQCEWCHDANNVQVGIELLVKEALPTVECPACHGSGQRPEIQLGDSSIGGACHTCKGSGRVLPEEA